MRKFLCASAAAVLSMAMAACGGSGGNHGASNASGSSKQYAEFRVGEMPWSGPLFFRFNSWDQTGQIESLVVQKLVELNANGQPKPGLASSIEHPSPTTYIYRIRKGVKFSDGKSLTVADVVYSLDINNDKLFDLKEGWENVASISARGSEAVVVKLKRPTLDWPNLMVMASGIVEKAAGERLKESELGSQHGLPIGTGPWKYDSYTPEVSVQLSRNPYWTGTPQPAAKISFTIFKSEAEMALALRSGAIDAAAAYETQKLFNDIPGTHRVTGSQSWNDWMSMNTSAPPLDDVHVRRAIAYATDVNGILKALYPEGGASADQTVVPTPLLSSFGSEAQVSTLLGSLPKYEFNLVKARQELAKSAYPHGFADEVVAFVGEPILLNMAQIIAADLKKIGITLQIKSLQADELTFPREDKAMFLNEFTSIAPDTTDMLMSSLLAPGNIYPSGNGVNWASYRNAELGNLVTQLNESNDQSTRLQLAQKALQIEVKEEPYLPLVSHSMFMDLSNKFVSPGLSYYTTSYTPWMLEMKLAR
jgi:peptide/nickel transport system substrate-binding protein